MGTRGKIVDVIHHLSPKVPMIFLGKCGNFSKIWCKVILNQTTESIFIPLNPSLKRALCCDLAIKITLRMP